MGFLKEFREFALKGSVVDLAVGVIIGGAFNKIVTSLIDDIVMPTIGKITGGVDFSQLYVSLDNKKYESAKQAREAGAAAIYYGSFITQVIQFLILAWVIFLMVKAINKMRSRVAPEPPKEAPKTPEDVVLLTEIRDLLRNQQQSA